jgi:hypothetical protein
MLVINHSVDGDSGGSEPQRMGHEEHVITLLEQAMSDTLPIPDRSSTRRKSSGDIFRALGNHCKFDEGPSRRSTADQPTSQPLSRARPNLSLFHLRRSSMARIRLQNLS